MRSFTAGEILESCPVPSARSRPRNVPAVSRFANSNFLASQSEPSGVRVLTARSKLRSKNWVPVSAVIMAILTSVCRPASDRAEQSDTAIDVFQRPTEDGRPPSIETKARQSLGCLSGVQKSSVFSRSTPNDRSCAICIVSRGDQDDEARNCHTPQERTECDEDCAIQSSLLSLDESHPYDRRKNLPIPHRETNCHHVDCNGPLALLYPCFRSRPLPYHRSTYAA